MNDPSAPTPRTTGGNVRWEPPSPAELQAQMPGYTIEKLLGRGGMGAVYKGVQSNLDRPVAIKILPPGVDQEDPSFAERFKNEARLMARLNNPAVVSVHDFGLTTGGLLYFAMEYVDGTDVSQMIRSQGKLPPEHALAITAHVCDALSAAHELGIVHRDIKPANVLINMEGQVKVADFGLAKATDPSQMGLTKTNMAMGTPDFVSPEALMPGVPLDGRADLYAVGVMLYNMLTGTIPRGAFRMPSATLQTDARFDPIIQKAMEMDRERRYQTALDLRRDLDVILTTPAAKSGVQTIPAQAALPARNAAPSAAGGPQKPMGKSPGAPARNASRSDAGGPQQRSADAPIRKEPAAKPARAPVQAPKKSNAAMIYGIAAAVAVIAVAIFLFSGGEKKPAAAPKAVAETKPEPKKPETKPATPPPSKPTPKPAESKPASAPAAVASGNEKWVDGLAQWFGGTKTKDGAVLQPDGAAKFGTNRVFIGSGVLFRDQAVRVRARFPNKDAGFFQVYVRRITRAEGAKEYLLNPQTENQRLRLQSKKLSADFPLPADFDYKAVHTLEFRVVGDLFTASVDGKKVGEKRDSQFADGYPVLLAQNVTIESFEYANLDAGGSAPALAAAKPSPAAPVEPVLTNTLGMKFVP
ncbi:MAG: protein kinase, partial [Prosthecobacter sp.]|nr:protein kinase [Prosthecobacter sp.]